MNSNNRVYNSREVFLSSYRLCNLLQLGDIYLACNKRRRLCQLKSITYLP